MKHLVAITKGGDLMCLTPLYPVEDFAGEYFVSIRLVRNSDEPLAYIVDAGDKKNRYLNKDGKNRCPLLNAEVLEKHVEILGEL